MSISVYVYLTLYPLDIMGLIFSSLILIHKFQEEKHFVGDNVGNLNMS